jgi:hypothetical protein
MSAIVIEHFHGAVTRIGVSETAVPHREIGYKLLIASEWIDPLHTGQKIAWTRRTCVALEPYFLPRRWLNYLGDDQGKDAVRGAYSPNFERLAEVKRRYDPNDLFRLNHNIDPVVH